MSGMRLCVSVSHGCDLLLHAPWMLIHRRAQFGGAMEGRLPIFLGVLSALAIPALILRGAVQVARTDGIAAWRSWSAQIVAVITLFSWDFFFFQSGTAESAVVVLTT